LLNELDGNSLRAPMAQASRSADSRLVHSHGAICNKLAIFSRMQPFPRAAGKPADNKNQIRIDYKLQ